MGIETYVSPFQEGLSLQCLTGPDAEIWIERFRRCCSLSDTVLRVRCPPIFCKEDWVVVPLPGSADNERDLFPSVDLEPEDEEFFRRFDIDPAYLRDHWHPTRPLTHFWQMLAERQAQEMAMVDWWPRVHEVFVAPPHHRCVCGGHQ